MAAFAQIKNINEFITAFLTEHGSEEMVEQWNEDENMTAFKKLLSKATKRGSGKAKDPNKPKRGKSSYIFFCAANRQAAKDELGDDAKATEVTAKLGEMWRALKESKNAADEKALKGFEDKAAEDKARYEEEMKDYVPPSDEELEKRKGKGKKDKNAPKRGKSAYIFFCADKRAEVKKELGEEAKATEVAARLGELWNELKADEDRADEMKVYAEQAAEDKARYEAEMETYKPPSDDEKKDDAPKKPAPTAKKGNKATKKIMGKKAEMETYNPPIEDDKEDDAPKKPAPTAKGNKATKKGSKKKTNGYAYFCREHRENVKKVNPDMKATDVTKELARMWKGLDAGVEGRGGCSGVSAG